jgi:hypothetical protein
MDIISLRDSYLGEKSDQMVRNLPDWEEPNKVIPMVKVPDKDENSR